MIEVDTYNRKQGIIVTLAVLTIAWSATANAEGPTAEQREQVKAHYIAADVNGDRHLEHAEFVQFVNLNADAGIGRFGMIRRFGMYGRAFSKIDMDRDGLIAPQELAELSKRRR